MKYVPTEKQNRNMKTKVLKYKFDGNTIVAPYMELEPYAENVFISLARKNEYGNESEDSFHVICKIGDIHFSCGQYSRRILDKEGHRKEAATYCRNWIENTLKDAEDGKSSHSCLSMYSMPSVLTPPLWYRPVRRMQKGRKKSVWNGKEKKSRKERRKKPDGNSSLTRTNGNS